MPIAHGRRLAEIFPNSRFEQVEDSYMLVPEDHHAAVAAHPRDFINATAVSPWRNLQASPETEMEPT